MHPIILADFALADGGAPKVAIDSAHALADLGLKVHFIHACGDVVDPLLDHPNITRVGLGLTDVWAQPIHKAAIAGIWNRAARQRLAAVLADVCTAESILHLHQWTKALSPAVFAAVRASGRPFAVTMHDYFIACPTGVFYRFDTHKPCTLAPLSAGCLTAGCDPRSSAHKAIRVLRLLGQNRALAGARYHVVHVSDRGAATVRDYLPGSPVEHRIDNPVPIAKRPPATPEHNRKALYLGRFTAEKGAIAVAEAARLADMPVLFVGEGPAEAAIRAANPAAEIRGWIKPSEVADLIAGQARVLVAPSQWPETGPLTVYEAMALGVPVIGSSMSGAAERIVDGATGFIVPPDVTAIAKALKAIALPGRAEQMGAAAYDTYWKSAPTPENHAAALYALYHDMLKGGAA
jgi:glycosyltransferase involved in cell wall biosynthesis